jgi:hypothetical protein
VWLIVVSSKMTLKKRKTTLSGQNFGSIESNPTVDDSCDFDAPVFVRSPSLEPLNRTITNEKSCGISGDFPLV